MATESHVIVSVEGPVTTLTLNRPEKRNALNVELLEAVVAAVARAEVEPRQRVLVLRGAGAVFCAGMDLSDATNVERTPRSAELVETALRRLATTRLVTIAGVQGAAVAGGAGLMSACDFVVATRDAKFGYPEVRRGLVPALIMTFLRRQLRERDARELLLLGKLIPAERALQIGLINRVVEDEVHLATEIGSLVASTLQGGPETMADTKAALAALWPSPLENDFSAAHAIHVAARRSSEAAEGIAAFLEKRSPKWAP